MTRRSGAADRAEQPAGVSTALLTDQYELTMLQAALRSGAAHRPSVFEVFARRLPPGRRYGVVAGTGRLLDAIRDFRFTDADLAWLRRVGVLEDDTLRWLADYSFTGTVLGYAEGDCFFPSSPILVVEGTFAEAVLLETLILSVLNHDCAIAAAASRMTAVAGGRPCLEMGSRRTHEAAAVAAARAAVVGGFEATSNLEAGRRYGLATVGTAAHSFTLLHDTEREAFGAQVAALGASTTLLVDTYDVEAAVALAVEVAGPALGAVRLDSGDLLGQAHAVRAQLDSLGATSTRIVVTSDLDEHAIAALGGAPVDAYGVGTSLVTGSGAPTAGLVYKLVARQGPDGAIVGVAKASKDKVSVAGRKQALRRIAGGTATAEAIGIDLLPGGDSDDRALLVPLVMQGEVDGAATGADAVRVAAARHAAALAELPDAARRLARGEPAIPTVFEPGRTAEEAVR